jgi:hypothetical protein
MTSTTSTIITNKLKNFVFNKCISIIDDNLNFKDNNINIKYCETKENIKYVIKLKIFDEKNIPEKYSSVIKNILKIYDDYDNLLNNIEKKLMDINYINLWLTYKLNCFENGFWFLFVKINIFDLNDNIIKSSKNVNLEMNFDQELFLNSNLKKINLYQVLESDSESKQESDSDSD